MRRPSYLLRGPTGLYYVRVRVPHALRQQRPDLPFEMRVPTGARNRRAAGRIAREVLGRVHRQLAQAGAQAIRDTKLIHLEGAKSPVNASEPVATSVLCEHVFTETLMAIYRLCNWNSAVEADGSGRFEVQPGDPPQIRRILIDAIAEAMRVSASGATAEAASAMAVPPDRDPLTRLSSTEVPPASPWALDAALEWRDWNVQHKKWLPLTWTSTYEPAIRLFTDLVAVERRAVDPGKFEGSLSRWDIRLSELTRAAIRRFVADLFRYPSCHGRRRDGSDAKQRLEAENRAGKKNPQTRENALKTIALIGTFLDRMREHGYVAQEVVDEIKIAARERTRSDGDGYVAFDRERLAILFGSEQYAQDSFDEAWNYWAPPMAVFTGGRVAEIGNACVHDFTVESDIPCWKVSDSNVRVAGVVYDRRVKSNAGNRTIPLHPTLVELGLLDYIEARRSAGAVWLFDGLNWEEKSGRGRYIGEWFREYTKSLHVYERRKFVFHSLRSNFVQALEATDLDDYLIDLVIGHSPKSTRGKHYRKRADRGIAVPVGRVWHQLMELDYGVTFHRSNRWSGERER